MKYLLKTIFILLNISLISFSCGYEEYTALKAGNEIDHDKVQKIPASASADEFKFQPKIRTKDGCQSYPAVDIQGNYSAGLKPTGPESGKCHDQSKSQTYVHSKCWKGKKSAKVCAYLYAWYYPKDKGFIIAELGHTHDWEDVIILTFDGKISRVYYSAHGKYREKPMQPGLHNIQGNTVGVVYKRDQTTHAVHPDSGKNGKKTTLISWSKMPSPARQTLNTVRWGSANCPIKDTNFLNNIKKAGIQNFINGSL